MKPNEESMLPMTGNGIRGVNGGDVGSSAGIDPVAGRVDDHPGATETGLVQHRVSPWREGLPVGIGGLDVTRGELESLAERPQIGRLPDQSPCLHKLRYRWQGLVHGYGATSITGPASIDATKPSPRSRRALSSSGAMTTSFTGRPTS